MILDQLAMIETGMSTPFVGSGVAEGVTSCLGVHFRREEALIAAPQLILGQKQEQQEQFQSVSFCSVFLSKGD